MRMGAGEAPVPFSSTCYDYSKIPKWLIVINFNFIATSSMLASGGYSASVPLDPFRVPTLLVQGFPNGFLL